MEDAEGAHEFIKVHHVVLLQIEQHEELQSYPAHIARQHLSHQMYYLNCLKKANPVISWKTTMEEMSALPTRSNGGYVILRLSGGASVWVQYC